MKWTMRLRLVGLLLLVACGSDNRVDQAFTALDGALPSQWQRVDEENADHVRRARYEVKGEPADVAALLRSSLVSQGFTFYSGSGLPDPSVAQPPEVASRPGPVNLGPPPTAVPPAVDAIQVRGFRGKEDRGVMRAVSFHPAGRPGWTLVMVTASAQD